MPELPEVETVRRGLTPALEGQTIRDVIIRRRDLRFPIPDGLEGRVEGQTVTALDRRSKYLLIRLESQDLMVLHLGMSGRIRIETGNPPPPDKHDHVEFITTEPSWIRFGDPRRFGFLDILHADQEKDYLPFTRLGREPFDPALNAEYLHTRAEKRRISLKAFLMDQSIVAGLGNIYVNEILFLSRLDPRRLCNTLSLEECQRLVPAITAVITDAIAAGGSTLKDHRQTSGEMAYFQHSFQVYGKDGTPCPHCQSTPIERIVQQNRASFFCSRCQS